MVTHVSILQHVEVKLVFPGLILPESDEVSNYHNFVSSQPQSVELKLLLKPTIMERCEVKCLIEVGLVDDGLANKVFLLNFAFLG